jgi:plastocyanin
MQHLKILSKSSVYSSSFIVLSLFFFLVFNGCSKNDYGTNAGGGTPGTNEIFIQNMSFSSGTKTITVGTKLTWTNKDGYAHTVTSGIPGSPSGVFDSGNIASNGAFSYTFNQAGVFKYYCRIHSNMTATITVQ